RLHHRVAGLDQGDKALGFDHAQRFHRFCHRKLLPVRKRKTVARVRSIAAAGGELFLPAGANLSCRRGFYCRISSTRVAWSRSTAFPSSVSRCTSSLLVSSARTSRSSSVVVQLDTIRRLIRSPFFTP